MGKREVQEPARHVSIRTPLHEKTAHVCIAKKQGMCYDTNIAMRGGEYMDIAKRITELREEVGENRKEFSVHTGIPVRTLEDWEAGRRTPPEYIPRLIEYQIKYEKLLKSNKME